MKAEELRIGNFVLHNGNWSYRSHSAPSVISWEESDWYALGEYTISLEDVSPIPLTEKWLIDFGFEKDDYCQHYYTLDFEIRLHDDKWLYCPISEYFPAYSVVLPYVHQLQNLYFAITGEELQL